MEPIIRKNLILIFMAGLLILFVGIIFFPMGILKWIAMILGAIVMGYVPYKYRSIKSLEGDIENAYKQESE